MNDERYRFLLAVKAYVASDPEAAPLVAQAASDGVSEALREALQRGADMETALAVAMAKRYKGADALIYDKLKKWQGKTALNWSSLQPNTRIKPLRQTAHEETTNASHDIPAR